LFAALDGAEKKFGGKFGADPQKNRNLNEKIVSCSQLIVVMPTILMPTQTDKARQVFEKTTGKNVADKVSN